MKKIVFFALCLLSLNSILIQTIFKDSNTFKLSVRAIVVVAIVAGIIFITKKFNKRILFLILISTIFMVIGLNTDELTFIFIFVMIQGMLDIEDRLIEKYMMWTSLIPVIVMFLFLGTGITHNQMAIDTTFQIRSRMTFGLPISRVPYVFDVVYGALVTLYIYGYNNFTKSKKIITFIFCFIIGTFFFIETDVRGGYSCLLILLVLSIIGPKIYKNNIFRGIIKILPIFFIMFIIVLYLGKNSDELNKMFSLRPFYMGRFFNSMSLIKVVTTTSVKKYMQTAIIDNTYIHLLIGGGIILSIYLYILYRKAIDMLVYNEKFIEISFIISMLFYFNVESIGIRPENVFSILWWYLIVKYGFLRYQCNRSEKNDSLCNSNL